jgi:hypothetical protein
MKFDVQIGIGVGALTEEDNNEIQLLLQVSAYF